MSSTEPTASSLLSSARRPGVVVRVDRATALIEFPAVPELVRVSWGPELLAAINQEPEATPTVGDRAEVRYWPDGRVTLTRVAPRRTLLTRADADGGSRPQVLAANVDVVAVVEGLVPDPDGRRIARLLALAWASGAEPVVLLTKADLAPHQAQIVADLTAVSNCPVVAVSALERTGIEPAHHGHPGTAPGRGRVRDRRAGAAIGRPERLGRAGADLRRRPGVRGRLPVR
jgi:ribosome biogenesis GTPase